MEYETKNSVSSWTSVLFSKAYKARIATLKMGTFTEFKVDVKGDHLSSNLNVCWIKVIFQLRDNIESSFSYNISFPATYPL